MTSSPSQKMPRLLRGLRQCPLLNSGNRDWTPRALKTLTKGWFIGENLDLVLDYDLHHNFRSAFV